MEACIRVYPMRMIPVNSRRLLYNRIRQNWKYQYGIIKTIIDWTIMLYLVVPTAVIGGAVYRSWWFDTPQWIEEMPFGLLFFVFFLLLWRGHFHTYVREADRIFLMKNERLMLQLKRGGIIYSYILDILYALILAFLIAPFWLHHYERSIESLILFSLLWISLKWVIMAVKGKMNVHVRGWRSLLRSLPLVIAAIIAWEVSYKFFINENIPLITTIIIIYAIGSFILIKKRFTSVNTFEQDLAIDEQEKTKYINLIFGMSMDMEKMPKSVPSRKRPRLYSRSNRIFKKRSPENGFVELFIKATTRNTEYILRYLQIIGVTIMAVTILPPLWLKLSIACFGLGFLFSWIGSVWHKVIASHPFTKKYAEDDGYFQSKKRVTTVLAISFVIIIASSLIINSWIRSYLSFF